MAKKEPLYELIKSLNQTEKRYFKLMASLQVQKKDQNYVKLFEAIEKQRSYHEKKIVDELKIKFIAQQKRHLYTKILESLRAYHAKSSVELEINSLLHDFDILLQKSLLRQAGKALDKAKRLAEEAELFTDVLKINQLETRLLHAENNVNELDSHMSHYKVELKEVVEKIENQVAFEHEYINIVKWNKQIEHVRNEEELVALTELLDQPIFKNEECALSVVAQLQYHYIKGLYYFFIGDYETSSEHFGKQLEIQKERPNAAHADNEKFIRSIANYTLLKLKLNDFKAFKEGYEELGNVKITGIQTQNYVDYLRILLKLMYLTNTGQFKASMAWIEKNEKRVAELEVWIEAKGILYVERNYMMFKSVVTYIGVGEYRRALRQLNNYLNTSDKDLKKDTYCAAVILDLLVHFKLGNTDLLEYSIKSAQRFLKNRSRLFAFEKAVMKFVKNAISSYTDKQLKEEYAELLKGLQPLEHDKFEKTVFQYFDFNAWLVCQIEDKELGDIYEEQFDAKDLERI